MLHADGVVQRQGKLLFLRPEEMRPGTRSQIWSDELIDELWGIDEMRRMLTAYVMDTRRASVQTFAHHSEVLASLDVAAVRRWAALFDGMMKAQNVLDHAGQPLRHDKLTLSLGSILTITYELSLEVAKLRLPRLIKAMEGHFLTGFMSTELNATSSACMACSKLQTFASAPRIA